MRLFAFLAGALLLTAFPAMPSPSPSSPPRISTAIWRSRSAGLRCRSRSILTNPDQDPHLSRRVPRRRERSPMPASSSITAPTTTRGWRSCSPPPRRRTRKVIVVADLMQRKSGDNPHLWYDPATMPALAKALAAELAGRDPAHQARTTRAALQAFLASLEPLNRQDRGSCGRNMPARPSPRPSRSSAIWPRRLGLDMRNSASRSR